MLPSNPQYASLIVQDLYELACVPVAEFDKPNTGANNQISAVVAWVEQEGRYYQLAPRSTATVDTSGAAGTQYFLGQNIVFAQTALSTQPSLFPAGATKASYAGSNALPGRWLIQGPIYAVRITDQAVTNGGDVTLFASNLTVGVKAASGRIHVHASIGALVGANADLLVATILLDGVEVPNKQAAANLAANANGSVELDTVLEGVAAGAHTINIRLQTALTATGYTVNPAGAGLGHATLWAMEIQ